MRSSRRTRAFTLVEALIAVVVGLAVLGIVLSMLNWTVRSLERSDQRLDARETAIRALSALRQLACDFHTFTLDEKAATLSFQGARLSGRIRLDRATAHLVLEPSTGGAEVLAAGLSELVLRQSSPGVLQVGLSVDRPEVQDGLRALGPCRVVDEIVIPVQALRTPAIPWHADPAETAPTSPAL